MGRKKTYDREELVSRALELFRDHGFAGTSTQMLVEVLAVNRYSLYAEFGSKQGLFDAVLSRYEREAMRRNFGVLEEPGAGLPAIRAVLERFEAAGASPGMGRGCLLCNTAVELGPGDPGGRGFVKRYFARTSAAFRHALHTAREGGELPAALDVDAEAAQLTAVVLGIFVMVRADAPPELIAAAARSARRHLDLLGHEANRGA